MQRRTDKQISCLTCPCHAQCKIMAELGWFPRKIGIKVEMSSWRNVCQEVLICSKANTSMSGQCLIGKLKSCFTCSYCPTSASLSRDSIKSKLFLTRMKKDAQRSMKIFFFLKKNICFLGRQALKSCPQMHFTTKSYLQPSNSLQIRYQLQNKTT